jgi:hypothetical protein
MTKTLNPIVAGSAVALATTLWAGSASAGDKFWGVFHQSEHTNLCINNPYQSGNSGNPLVVNENCNTDDKGSVVLFTGYTWPTYDLSFITTDWNQPGHCVDNLYGKQEDWNPIVAWACNQGDTQMWDWDGASIHYHANPAFCITVAWDDDHAGAGHLVLYHCIGQGNQKFVLDAWRSRMKL